MVSLRDLEFRLGVSRRTLRQISSRAGAYYSPFTIQCGAKSRRIDNPTGRLRVLQNYVQERLLVPVQVPDCIHGGVRGRSPVTNVAPHIGHSVVVTVDIGDFFPSITHHRVFHAWRHTLGCTPTIARLLTQLTTFEGHLPQGAPTSTTLANVVLYAASEKVRKACATLNLIHTTFVDDLAFSGERARDIIDQAVLVLREAGFRVPHRKTRIMGKSSQKRVTGLVLGRKPKVPRQTKSKVRAALHRLASERRGTIEYEGTLQSARGLMAHISHVEPKAGDRLRRQLSQVLEQG